MLRFFARTNAAVTCSCLALASASEFKGPTRTRSLPFSRTTVDMKLCSMSQPVRSLTACGVWPRTSTAHCGAAATAGAEVVTGFGFDWRGAGTEIETNDRFPDGTNVSFVRVVDRNTIDVRFFERGAGETMSSGTGSTGAAAAALARGYVDSPVKVLTPAGPLDLRWEDGEIYLVGPAQITVRGEFFLQN